MKKLLAVLIAIIMIVSTMPVAFAQEECEHRFDNFLGERPNVRDDGYCYCSVCGAKSADFSGVVEVFYELMAINFSIYEPTAGLDRECLDEVINETTDALYCYEEGNYFFIGYATEEDQGEIDFRVNNAKAALKAFKDEGYAVLYDGTEVATLTMMVQFGAQWVGGNSFFSAEMLNEEDAAFDAYEAIAEKGELGLAPVTEQECAAEAEKLMACYRKMISCLEGNHVFGEYTDNGDGTSTAKCEYCTTTDTVEAEKKDILDILSADLVELMKMLFALVKSFIETVFA